MKVFIADHAIATPGEYLELALGIDRELFRGPRTPESTHERAARLDAARDIIDHLREQGEADLAAYAEQLLASAPVPLARSSRRTVVRGSWGSGVAA